VATGTCAAGAPGVTTLLLAPRPLSLLPDPDPLLLAIPKETGRTWQLQQHRGWFTGLVEEHHDGSVVEQVAEDAGLRAEALGLEVQVLVGHGPPHRYRLRLCGLWPWHVAVVDLSSSLHKLVFLISAML
jgi:hypothetical protein